MQSYTIKTLVLGQLETNCYLVQDTSSKETLIIDPGDDAGYINDTLRDMNAIPKYIVATHGHFDHILAAYELQLALTIPFMVHEKDRFLVNSLAKSAAYFLKREIIEQPPRITRTIKSQEEIIIGKSSFQIIETPGHTPGSVSLHDRHKEVLFSGDTLFADGGVGRTDFSYSSASDLEKSVKHLLSLSEATRTLSGHGTVSNIEKERAFHQF